MVALTGARMLDFGDALPKAAREAIEAVLAQAPRGSNRVYAALVRKVWSLLIERRVDAEIRDWHALLNDVRAHLRERDAPVAERMTALADLLHESIALGRASPALAVATRPNAQRILERLAAGDGYLARRVLLDELGLRSANLSNVLTQLLAHNLVERRDRGKEAEFRITRLGRQLSGAADAPLNAPTLHTDVLALGAMLETDVFSSRSMAVELRDAVGSFEWLITPATHHGVGSVDHIVMPLRGVAGHQPYHRHQPELMSPLGRRLRPLRHPESAADASVA